MKINQELYIYIYIYARLTFQTSNSDVRMKKKFTQINPYNNLTLSDQIRSVAQSCPTFCDPMNHSTPGLPVHHQLPEFTQTHVHWVSDAIQPSHSLSSPSPPAPNPSQHQSLFQWVNSSHEVAKVLEFLLYIWNKQSLTLLIYMPSQCSPVIPGSGARQLGTACMH